MQTIYKKNGKLEVICGSMFSGKSDELIRRIKRATYAHQTIQVFKHAFDDRTSLTHICAHNGNQISAHPITHSHDLINLVAPQTEIVGVDEIQFFDLNIILAVDTLVRMGKRVIVAGLDLDFRGIPFGPMPFLLALADEILKLKAVCMKSGKEAHFSQRLIDGSPARHEDPLVAIGAQNLYEARSRAMYEIDDVPLKQYLKQYQQ